MDEYEVLDILEKVKKIEDKDLIIKKLAEEVIRLINVLKIITNKHPLDGGWN